jgi:glutathione peroxidase
MKNFYELQADSINGEKKPLKDFSGQVALVVNTASECGFTKQYAGLEHIYEKYQPKGFVILAFPSNDFGGQEPGSNEEIKDFCEREFHTRFPLFSKAPVKGAAKQPVYQFLTDQSDFKGEITWNFEKFLVDRKGKVIARFEPKTEPESQAVISKIEQALQST